MEFEKDEYGNIFSLDRVEVLSSYMHNFWRDMAIGVFDFETNSLDYHKPDEFRVVQFFGGMYREPEKDSKKIKAIDTLNIFVNPGMAVGAGAMKVHGLYHSEYDAEEDIDKFGQQDLAGEPLMADVFEDIAGWLDQFYIWCAFNGAFDVNCLNSEGKRLHGEDYEFVKPWIDPLPWQRHLTGKNRGNKLGQVARSYGVGAASMKNKGGKLHDAQTDCDVLAGVTWAMAPKLPQKCDELFERQFNLIKARGK